MQHTPDKNLILALIPLKRGSNETPSPKNQLLHPLNNILTKFCTHIELHITCNM